MQSSITGNLLFPLTVVPPYLLDNSIMQTDLYRIASHSQTRPMDTEQKTFMVHNEEIL
jgi:hypothetical protein